MALSATSGTKVYIGGVRLAATDTAAEYAALTWVPIEQIENIGEFGDEAAQITFDDVGESRTKKLKGNRNAGMLALVCGWDPLGTGQIAVRNAEKTSFDYAFKIEANDKLDANDTNSIFYFHAKVASARRVQGGANDVVKMNANLDITTEIVEVAATVVP